MMLLEKGEFIRCVKTGAIRWIEQIDRRNKLITLGKMEYKDNRYSKSFLMVTFKEFYEEYEDV